MNEGQRGPERTIVYYPVIRKNAQREAYKIQKEMPVIVDAYAVVDPGAVTISKC